MRLKLLYLYRNLTRNPRRTQLTCAAVALPIMIMVLSAAVIDGFERFLGNSAKQLRLAVTHKTSIVNRLPEGYRLKMESLDPTRQHMTSICAIEWIGGSIDNDPRPLSTLAADHDTFPLTFPEYLTQPDELEAWQRDRQALIVGSATAGQFGWKKGDRITIQPSVPPYTPMQFHVVSTAEGAPDPVTLWLRRDYLEAEIEKAGYAPGLCSFFFVKCANKADLEHYRNAIDDLFARSTDETGTLDEKAFMNQFVTQQFDLPRNLKIFAAVTVFVAVMAAANTMSMNFRDRINEYATLKSLGFSSPTILTLIQGESLLLCALGGLVGALVPYILFTYTPLKDQYFPLIQTLSVRPDVCVQAVALSLGIGLISGAWPAVMAARMHVVAALRNLE